MDIGGSMRRKGMGDKMLWEIGVLGLGLLLGAIVLMVGTGIIGGGEFTNNVMSFISDITAGRVG
jgi:hypothetical protein